MKGNDKILNILKENIGWFLRCNKKVLMACVHHGELCNVSSEKVPIVEYMGYI